MIQEYLRQAAEKMEADFLGNIKSAEDWQQARPRLAREYFDMLGLWPLPEKTPLSAKVTRTLDRGEYFVEMLHYQSRPGLYVTGNLYRPTRLPAGSKLPGIVYVCGHSPRPRNGNKTAYQSHGIWFARHGYVCLVLDTLEMGELTCTHHGTYRDGRWRWLSRGYTPAGAIPENDHIPTFNLKAVVHETGLKPDTIRAWERRYGLPVPDRSTGGHRLYSQRDIRLLKWLIARQAEGMSISRAVELWRRHGTEGRDPLGLPEYADGLHAPIALAGGETLAELRADWVEACMRFDEQSAEHVLAQAFALYPPEVVCFDLLQKGLSEIGDGWYQGEITVWRSSAKFLSGLWNLASDTIR